MGAERSETDIVRLIADHHQSVYRYAYRLTGCQADAEDLCQQVFLKAHEKISQLRDVGSARSWLFTILRNSFFKSCRHRFPIPAGNFGVEIDDVVDEIPQESAVDTEQLQRALGQLPEKYRVVLLMFYYEDISYREIAEKLKVPIGTVMSRLSRAKRQLRAGLLEAISPAATGS